MDGSLGKGKHADIFEMLIFPIGELNDLMELRNNISMILQSFFLEIVAFVGRVESKDVLLFEDLEVMKDYNHTYFDFFLFVVEEEHEINLYMFEWIA